MARTTIDSDSRSLGIRKRSTPELESFNTRHPAKQNSSSHGRGIANESTIAQQQTRHPKKCNHSSNNVGLRRIRILGATPTLSAPHFGPPAPTKDSWPKLELLFMARQSEANARTWEHGLQKRSKVPPKGSEGQSKGEMDDDSRSNSSWHCGTIHHRMTKASKDAQCETLKIPLGAKVTNDTSGRVSEASCLSRDTPRTLTDAFSNRAPECPIHGQVNGTREQVCTHPRTTRTMEQVSGYLSRLVLVSRVSPDPERGPRQTESNAQSSFGEKLTSGLHTTHSLRLLGLGKSFRLGPSKSVRSPE
ncbi:hypothetical protein CDL15_Pgr017207 [Punica granatum]|uniref:Uncharacterized protein n=1 Tax=Punica granatum TaxID=22663 RepID=A0A218WVF2_PUNGR|nr:hypothetical protein CDL15_Pgr017207 [Punica granatum]